MQRRSLFFPFAALATLCFAVAPARFAHADTTATPNARLPQSITVKQRSAASLASSGLPLTLTIGDITGGRVVTYVADADGANVLDPRAMQRGDAAPFRSGGRDYSLRLDALDNALVGDDYAVFTVSAIGSLSETEKIERLLVAISSLDARFVRNGKDYSPRDAVDHLRRKWKAASGHADDARRFIDELASMSSISGQPYRIRYSDGRETTAREFLLDELARLDAR